MLQGFSDKDTIDQIVLLDTIKDSGRIDLLPDLMDLYATPHPDQAVEEIVYYSLVTLLRQAPEAILRGLRHPSQRVRLVAIQCGGEEQIAAAFPVLVEQLQAEVSPEFLGAIILALSHFHDPTLPALIAPFVHHPDDTVAAYARQALELFRDR